MMKGIQANEYDEIVESWRVLNIINYFSFICSIMYSVAVTFRQEKENFRHFTIRLRAHCSDMVVSI